MTVRQYFAALQGKRVVVLGLGVSNLPLMQLLLDYGCTVTGCDKTPLEHLPEEVRQLADRGAVLRTGPGYLDGLTADVVFRTPGMHPDIPALQALRQVGAVITSEMEAFFAVCPAKLIAVTGSDGKTTTATLISELLKRAGRKVWLGGNIGTPLLQYAEQMQPEDFAVVELSSFQLMYFPYSAHVAVVTNLAPNHLDIHKDMQEYIDAKKNVFLHQSPADCVVLNADNAITRSFAACAPGKIAWFSRRSAVENGVFLEDGVIYRAKAGARHRIMAADEILLPGVHNIENYMAAIAAVGDHVTADEIAAVARSFGGVEHRIEFVRQVRGVRYYNDSIASSPTRTIAGLRSFPQKVILIAGGYDKHIPYDVLGPEICSHVKILITTGATGPKIRDAMLAVQDQPHPQLEEVPDFADAVRRAANLAQPGDVVLMSPASAAFDHFKNFMVRGKFFKQLVQSL